MTGLQQWYQPELSNTLNREQLLMEDRAELQMMVGLCDRALAMPRRIGADATSAELASDKKTGRRLCHVFRQSLKAWEGQEASSDELGPEVRKQAAMVRWEDVASDRSAYLLARIPLYVTIAVDTDQKKWGWHMITIIQNELRWINYALR